ncbi:MAG: hypothetical protein WC544_04485 [Patescibacteria group bacterium]
MSTTKIFASEISQYKGRECPACRQGTLREAVVHDPVTGTATVLRCTQTTPCAFTIEIDQDPDCGNVHHYSTMEGIPR